MHIFKGPQAVLAAQRGHLFPWVPVALASGIGLYLALKWEPALPHYLLLGGLALFFASVASRAGVTLGPLLWLCALLPAGVILAGARAHMQASPVLDFRYYGAVEGRIVAIDRSASDALRLTLDRVWLDDVPPPRTPARVRIALHGEQGFAPLAPGRRVMMTAHLSPPGGPVEPGGFDFQRHSWFLQLGAVGYTRSPVLLATASREGAAIAAIRLALSGRVQAALPGERGAFAAAIMTGDRAGISQGTLKALRDSNLAHLLAISGLHMGLLAGFVFAAFRLGFAAIPYLGLRWPAKKLSAGLALMVAAGYLALSGGNVATERAFVMVAVMLVAVILNRRALSLRAVAVAALIVLVLRPEALLSPGFQMSFAATTALVAVFGAIRDNKWSLGPKWLQPLAAVVISSAVAGAATGPVGAAHFNQMAHFGLPANLVSVPLMGVLVMPAAVLAAILMPFGLEAVALWLMGQGLAWVLAVAHWVADRPGATGGVVAPDGAVLPMMALGMLWLILWQGRARVLGLAPALAAVVLWAQTERPPILISESGGLVGVLTSKGRALSAPRGAGFVASIWLENDGSTALQAQAAALWPGAVALGGGSRLLVAKGKRALAAQSCDASDWVVTNVSQPRDLPCRVLSPRALRDSGALAIWPDARNGPRILGAKEVSGARLWNGGAPDRAYQ
ncbi:ComEC/Rec2 family competence protein [Lutimaribacter sp. EGI FJ00015]|uniref:ComEC/Rec2 family competence protein n=1 Tax=Lutimaribacter degradans TaxID=2945989 RepID=A0ACC5ZV28_9RHOB|nr:ComEC/Rec2 family competence protein [Lutimaribacter sp. EGI FJ00013]MCM2562136.1 ComEC/Rec2 family competence protein [Lutimaribacter sp. EGI FJ00013]MCO0613289.1 ComEC/Rec2 family competence protein [Lutimaribacter sp. EGI FJ00015]MCO0636266.1 ComEC/Rec2 family competence protein [Lutimaribacter sp. EGI FJ00014]